MKFYKRDPDKALAGMVELTLKERGAYNTLLDLLYSRDGAVPDDDEMIRRVMGCHGNEWRGVKAALISKGKVWIEDGFLHANRVDETLEEAAEFSETQRKRAGKRWEKSRKRLGNGSENPKKPNDNNERRMPLTPTAISEAKASGADAPEDLSLIVFGQGLRFLIRSGLEERSARTMLGKWRQQHGDAALLAALGRAQREGALDPVAFVQGCFRAMNGNGKANGGKNDEFERIIRAVAGSSGGGSGAEAMACGAVQDAAQLRIPDGSERGRENADDGRRGGGARRSSAGGD